MTRRQLLSLTGSFAARAVCAEPDPDISLRIAEMTLDLGQKRSVKTLAYNGQTPGPLLRVKEGKPVTVEVFNGNKEDELVHWHGFHIPSDVDGAHEEGTPHVAPNSQRRYTFTPNPAGTRWYHSHGMAGRNLTKSTYSGMFGMIIVEPASDPGRYDLEVPILLHEWDGFFNQDHEIEYKTYSINGKILGAGEPVRVKQGQRALFRILNASATETHRLGLAGHRFQVIALDGNAVANPARVPLLELGPGERVDAIVEMDAPGVWILGEQRDEQRKAGMGIVIEYADATGPPRWAVMSPVAWDYTVFGGTATAPEPDGRFPMVFKSKSGGHEWMINGKSFPKTDPMVVTAGRRYRLIFNNQSSEAHPVHLHRHTFEITRFVEKVTSGIHKDVVMVPAWKQVEVDVVAANPGPTLFHCHQQFHMDFGFMAMMRYAD